MFVSTRSKFEEYCNNCMRMVSHTSCRASLQKVMSMRFRKLSTASRCFYPRRLSLFLLSITVVCVLFFEFFALESMKRGRMSRSVSFDKVPVDETGVLRFAAVDTATGEKISFEDWIRIISDSDSSDLTIQKMVTILKEAPYKAYRFETPGVSPKSVSITHFEFAVVDDVNLYYFAATPRPVYFEEYLSSPSCDGDDGRTSAGCVFQNLGGDATLVAPTDWSPQSSPRMYSSCYGHLANFVRGGPELQILNTWKILGNLLKEKLLTRGQSTAENSNKPIWFSTAGTGVPYLHFRLDSRPKYYQYDPFKKYL